MTYLIDQIILSPPCANAELCNACRDALNSDPAKLCDEHLAHIAQAASSVQVQGFIQKL